MEILSEIRSDKDIMSKEYVKGLIYNPKKIISDFKINNTSLMNYTGLFKLLGEDTTFTGSAFSFDYHALDDEFDDEYKPSHLLRNITTNENDLVPLGGLICANIEQESVSHAYWIAMTYGTNLNNIITQYSISASNILYPDGTVFDNTINNNNGYLYAMELDWSTYTFTKIYILSNISTLTYYGDLSLSQSEEEVWMTMHDSMPNDGDCIEPNEYIWKCLFIKNANFGEKEINLQTNSAYDAVNNKIATMSDINNYIIPLTISTETDITSLTKGIYLITFDTNGSFYYINQPHSGGGSSTKVNLTDITDPCIINIVDNFVNIDHGCPFCYYLNSDLDITILIIGPDGLSRTTIITENALAKNNSAIFTPTGDYNPATKKYVDNKIVRSSTEPTDSEAELWIEDTDIDSSCGGAAISVIDNLTSTSATNALSANQGKVLNTRLTTIENKNLVESSNINNIVMVTDYPSNPDPNTLYVKVASL